MAPFFKSLKLQGITSFAPDAPAIELSPINLIIGANGSGKSNFIDILRFISTLGGDMEQGFRDLGGPADFFWRGKSNKDQDAKTARIELVMAPYHDPKSEANYRVEFLREDNDISLQDEGLKLIISGKDLRFLQENSKLKKYISINPDETMELSFKMTADVNKKAKEY
ncbi:MAG: AAA family ATPase, partial [Alphaproteobacteria bacterium]|nr:AAA family ATPase [Alphaproteobacteria bacterium]